MVKSKVPKKLWDDFLKLKALIYSNTTHDIFERAIAVAAAGYDRFYDPSPGAVSAYLKSPTTIEEMQVHADMKVDPLTSTSYSSLMTLLTSADRIADIRPEKLDAAREFGATDGVLASAEAPWKDARAILGKGADAVFVTVGVPQAFTTAPNYLGPAGRVVMVGMPPSGATAEYEPVNLAYLAQGMIGSKMGDVVIKRDIPWMIDLYGQGRLMLDELISNRWSLEQINEAIADTKTGTARRNVILLR